MASLITLGELNLHFNDVRDTLSAERRALLETTPSIGPVTRDAYGFSYLKAEHIGLDAIASQTKDIAWLPVKLDHRPEIALGDRAAFKDWLAVKSPATADRLPDASDFGNDFIHALTRTALQAGWDSPVFEKTTHRLGVLFHDLSCLIGLVFYGVWLAENKIEGVPITNPHDLERTASEIAQMTRSPEIAELLKRRKQVEDDKRARLTGRVTRPPPGKPALHLVEHPPVP